MNKLTKKIVAIVTTITCAVWMMGPGVANALTAAELQVMINDLLAQIATLQSQIAEMEGGEAAVTGCTITSFDRALKVGMSGDDVKCLQIVLNTASDTQLNASGVGSPGNETSYFGPLTEAGVITFQEKYADDILASWGLTSGTGYVGSTTRAKLNTLLSTVVVDDDDEEEEEEEEEEEVTTGPVTIALAADTPEATQVALNAQDTVFTKIKFSGGDEGVTITKIIVKRGGIAYDVDISAIKLYDGTTQIGSSQALNSTTHKATFSSLSWEVPAGETKYLTIKGSIAAKGIATVGDSIKLGIDSAADITASATIEGTFPIYGASKTLAGIGVGEAFCEKTTAPASTTILSGATEQKIAAWKFTASSSEGIEIHSIKVSHVGTAAKSDISNVKLMVSGVQIGETIEELDAANAATFDLSDSPLAIVLSGSKTVYAYADVAGGIWTARTIIFEITQYTDITVYGANSGGIIQAAKDDTTAFSKQTGNTMTIGQGTLAVAIDAAYNPASQKYVVGTENRLFAAYKFTTGSREGVRVVKLRLKNTGTGSATDLSNVTLWDGSTQIAGPASLVGAYVTFGSNTIGWDATGLFDVEEGSTKTITVRADIPTGATAGNTLDLDIDVATDVYADGLDSQYDVPASSVTGTANANQHEVDNYGSLAVSLSALTPPAQTYIKGSTEKEFLRINLSADSGEDIVVSALTFDLFQENADACDSGDLTNVKVLKSDGTQYGSTVASPDTEASFSDTITVSGSETVTLRVIADIPSTTGATTTGMHIDLTDNDDITSTGVSSAHDMTETVNAADGKQMAVGEGELTISSAAIPGDQTVIIGATEISMVGLIMTAGSAEDIRVTKVKVTGCLEGGGRTEAEFQENLSNIALWDGTTILTTKKGWDSSTASTVDFTASDFLNSSGIDISKGQQKTITVRADLPSTGQADDKVAFGIATTSADLSGDYSNATTADVIFVGLDSNATPVTKLNIPSLGGVNYSENGDTKVNWLLLASSGTLTAAANAATPEIGMISIGSTGRDDVAFLKIDYEASREDILVKSFEIKRIMGTSTNADFGLISLWDGDTQIGGSRNLINRGLAYATTTFSLPTEDYWTIPAGETKVLTVKADLSGMRTADQTGVTSGDAPKLCLSTTTAMGSSSGNSIWPTAAAEICGNVQILYKSKPALAAASLPSTVLGAGEKVLYRWTVTADEKGAIGWSKVVFDISGSITYHAVNCTIGKGGTATGTDGIVYVGTSTDAALDTSISYITNLNVFNVATGDEVEASTTDNYNPHVWNYGSGGARVSFIPDAEQVIAAGATKTYELRGDLGLSPTAGDAISIKINKRATATTTEIWATVAELGAASGGTNSTAYSATGTATFVWTDRSGNGTTHDFWGDSDWALDYKVSGLPTATLSLSR